VSPKVFCPSRRRRAALGCVCCRGRRRSGPAAVAGWRWPMSSAAHRIPRQRSTGTRQKVRS